jgi:PAS domain S-box-containing protein
MLSDVHRPAAVTYAMAVVALVAAVVLRRLLDPFLGEALPFVTMFGAVAVGVSVGGSGPAALNAQAGYVACNYQFIVPRGRLFVVDTEHIVGLAAYLFTCLLIILIGHAMRVAQARAHRRGELMRVTLSSIGDAVITTDTRGRVTSLNEVAETLTGWQSADAAGQPLDAVLRLVSEDTRQPIPNPALRALAEGVAVGLSNHTTLIAKDGTERAIDDSAAPIRSTDGAVTGSVLVFRDITPRREWERDEGERLIAARQLASIVETSDDAIIRKSLDGIIQSWNAGAERVFGYTADEAVGRHISLIIPPERLAEEEQIIASLKAGKRVDHFETERRHRSGGLLWVSLTISPIEDDEGRIVAASKIARDVTRQRQLADDLAAADRQKNEFLATLAHELRNPLAPLGNMLEVLKRADHDPQARTAAVTTMERQLRQLVRLVDDLLDLSRITHNRLDLRHDLIDLGVVVAQAIEAARPLAEASGHEILTALPPAPLRISADAVRLSQILGNLLNNACKYTPHGGRIGVEVAQREHTAVVTVSDTGEGIPPDRLHAIFDMFTQLDTARERSQGGLGIGLTLVRRLVEMHGGTVEARSEGVGKGSQFVVRLPLAVDPAPARTSLQPLEGVASRRILIVDDNHDAAASLSLLLELDGHMIMTVHDGPSALAAAEAHRPDVVLLDIGLPVMSGYDVARRIRDQEWGRAMVLVALTGWGQDEDRARTRAAGFDAHLVKPANYPDLVQLLRSVSVER